MKQFSDTLSDLLDEWFPYCTFSISGDFETGSKNMYMVVLLTGPVSSNSKILKPVDYHVFPKIAPYTYHEDDDLRTLSRGFTYFVEWHNKRNKNVIFQKRISRFCGYKHYYQVQSDDWKKHLSLTLLKYS